MRAKSGLIFSPGSSALIPNHQVDLEKNEYQVNLISFSEFREMGLWFFFLKSINFPHFSKPTYALLPYAPTFIRHYSRTAVGIMFWDVSGLRGHMLTKGRDKFSITCSWHGWAKTGSISDILRMDHSKHLHSVTIWAQSERCSLFTQRLKSLVTQSFT